MFHLAHCLSAIALASFTYDFNDVRQAEIVYMTLATYLVLNRTETLPPICLKGVFYHILVDMYITMHRDCWSDLTVSIADKVIE